MKKIAIIGGGMTGLSAAYYLKKAQLPYEIKLLEASDRLGGKIETIHQGGYIIEKGPDSFLARKRPGMELMEELGLTGNLIRNKTGQAYVLVDDHLHPIPHGSYMGIPVQKEPFLQSNIVSKVGKKHALDELILPKGEEAIDQSLGNFFRRRFGDELVENLLEPLLSGIYSGNIDQMSLMATFPNFYQLEQKYGSLLKGLYAELPKGQANTGEKAGQFVTLKHGLTTVVDALMKAIGTDHYRLNAKVISIRKTDTYQIMLHDGKLVEADAVILATPHQLVPNLFQDFPFLSILGDIPLTSVANVVLAYDASAINNDLEGTGFVVSRKSPFTITACTWTDRKWAHTTPNGKVLFRAFVGKPTDQAIVSKSDEELVEIVQKDLSGIMDINGTPEFTIVNRFKNAMPQYTVGHQERIKKVQLKLKEDLPGIFLAGASYHGVGLPDCIGQGKEAAGSVIEFLSKEKSWDKSIYQGKAEHNFSK